VQADERKHGGDDERVEQASEVRRKDDGLMRRHALQPFRSHPEEAAHEWRR
jgi:hypothetical protein